MTEIKQKDVDDFWESDLGKQFVGVEGIFIRGDFEECLAEWLYGRGSDLADIADGTYYLVLNSLLVQYLGGRPISTLATEDRSQRVVEIDVLKYLVAAGYLTEYEMRDAAFNLSATIAACRAEETEAFQNAYEAETAEYEALPWRKRVFRHPPIKGLCYTDSDLKIGDEV